MSEGIFGTSSIEIEEAVTINVYVNNGVTEQIEILTGDSKLAISKIVGNDESKYQLLVEGEGKKLQLSIGYTGLENMQNVKGSYEVLLAMSETEKYRFKLNTEVAFTDSVDIEEFTESNSLCLTDSKYEEENVRNFLEAITSKLEDVDRENMEKLGLEEDENPLQYALPIQMVLGSIMNGSMQSLEGEEAAQVGISEFNSKYMKYESEKSSAQTARGLMSEIQNDDEQNSKYKIKEINFNGEEVKLEEVDVSEIKEKLDSDKNYRIEFEMDPETGAIYRIVLSEVS